MAYAQQRNDGPPPPPVPPVPHSLRVELESEYGSQPHFDDPLVAPRPHKLQPDLPANVCPSDLPFIESTDLCDLTDGTHTPGAGLYLPADFAGLLRRSTISPAIQPAYTRLCICQWQRSESSTARLESVVRREHPRASSGLPISISRTILRPATTT